MGRFRNAWQALTASSSPPRPAPRRRSFAAGTAGGRLYGSFSGTRLSADEQVVRSLDKMRARSRQLANDNPYMARFLKMAAANIVGPKGIALQARSRRGDGTLDQIDNDAIEEAFALFSRRGNFEVTGQLSRAAAERMVVTQVARDGEILVRKRPGYSRSAAGYALQFIDPDVLDHRLNVKAERNGGNKIKAGVEVDGDDRAVAYWLLRQHPGETPEVASNFGRTHQRISADDMLHLYVPTRAGQHRGVPWAHASILGLQDLGDYREAALVAAKIGAKKVGWLVGDDLTEADDDIDSDGEIIMPSEAGEFGVLPDGTDLREWDPTYPHDQFEPFNKAMLRGISAGAGVSYPGFANDLEGVNFSSIRQGVLDERDGWMVLQDWLVDSFNESYYPGWLDWQLMRGAIGTIPAGRLEAKLPHIWQPRRWQWVDPLKDIQAAREAYDLRIKSRSQIIRELGRDPDDVWREIQAEDARLAELGVSTTTHAPVPAGVAVSGGDEIWRR